MITIGKITESDSCSNEDFSIDKRVSHQDYLGQEGKYLKVYLESKLKFAGTSQEFFKPLKQRVDTIISVLSETISSLKKTQDYNGAYIAYILEQISDEDFENSVKEYIFDPQTEITEEILDKIEILFSFCRESFTPSDLADIFKLDEEVVETSIRLLLEKRLIE